MGTCCANKCKEKTLYFNYKGNIKFVRPHGLCYQQLRTLVRQLYSELKNKDFSLYCRNFELTSNESFIKALQGKSLETIHVEALENQTPLNVSGSIALLQVGGVQHLGFITNLNLLMTTHQVLNSKEAAELAECDYFLDPQTFFYTSKVLGFSLVAVKHNVYSELLPIVCKQVRPKEKLLCNNSFIKIKSVDPYGLSYECDCLPGSPILSQGKVVGMHIAKNSGLNIQAAVQELQNASNVNYKVRQLLNSIVFQDLTTSPQDRFIYTYKVSKQGLVSFNTRTNEFKFINLDIPKDTKPCQVPGGLFITGGFSNKELSDFTGYFDSYTMSLVVKQSMQEPRALHTSAYSNNTLFVISGVTPKGVTGRCEALNTKKNQWKSIPSIKFPRTNSSSTFFGNELFVVGGCRENGSVAEEIEKFNGKHWETLHIKLPELRGDIKILSGKHEILLLGKRLWEFTDNQFQAISEERAELPSKHCVLHKGNVFCFLSDKALLKFFQNTWQYLEN